jgi:hypothetical protein
MIATSLGKMPTTSVRRLISPFEALEWIGRVDLGAMLLGDVCEQPGVHLRLSGARPLIAAPHRRSALSAAAASHAGTNVQGTTVFRDALEAAKSASKSYSR